MNNRENFLIAGFNLKHSRGENVKKLILDKKYQGFESCSDISRDIDEMWDERFNPVMKNIPNEFQGTIRILVTYEDESES